MTHIATLIAQAPPVAPHEEIYLFVSLGLLGLALVLLVLELFVPTGGVLAVMVGVAAVASIASMFAYDTTWGGLYLVALCAGSPLIVILIFKVWSKTPIANRMVLRSDADGHRRAHGDDETGEADPSRGTIGAVARTTDAQLKPLVGRMGEAVTTLRPIGFIRVDGVRIEAVAESGFIQEGCRIAVIEANEGQLKVREVPTSPQAGAQSR